MYLTVKEIAEFLELPEPYIENMIYQKKIRAIHDGEQFLVNKNQFDTHLNEMEKYKEIVMEILTQPIPEDIDVRDED
ncbi:excisionase family DNA-binding protein [Evansella clarkii]|jgi:excisionase family DNA binding protein|uniref:excisionase family DNA-binding protein n=1 Tax=Evansella clarkii TaxID=79879 RepID=UPI000998B16D|nr:excisionase family DNA-binding protein [Evansella clarkii]